MHSTAPFPALTPTRFGEGICYPDRPVSDDPGIRVEPARDVAGSPRRNASAYVTIEDAREGAAAGAFLIRALCPVEQELRRLFGCEQAERDGGGAVFPSGPAGGSPRLRGCGLWLRQIAHRTRPRNKKSSFPVICRNCSRHLPRNPPSSPRKSDLSRRNSFLHLDAHSPAAQSLLDFSREPGYGHLPQPIPKLKVFAIVIVEETEAPAFWAPAVLRDLCTRCGVSRRHAGCGCASLFIKPNGSKIETGRSPARAMPARGSRVLPTARKGRLPSPCLAGRNARAGCGTSTTCMGSCRARAANSPGRRRFHTTRRNACDSLIIMNRLNVANGVSSSKCRETVVSSLKCDLGG